PGVLRRRRRARRPPGRAHRPARDARFRRPREALTMDAANGATTKATADVTSKVTPDDPAAAADGRSPGRGATVIGERAVEKIVAAAIDSVPGTVSAGSAINRMAGRAYPRVDVQIDARGGSVTVETDVAVSWP